MHPCRLWLDLVTRGEVCSRRPGRCDSADSNEPQQPHATAYDHCVITLVFASHGRLAEVLLQTIEGIAGRQPHIEVCGLLPGVEPAEFSERLNAVVQRCAQNPVLVLCDLRFGTPYNIARRFAAECANVEVLSGLNLPMGLEAALGAQDETDVRLLASRVREAVLRDLGDE